MFNKRRQLLVLFDALACVEMSQNESYSRDWLKPTEAIIESEFTDHQSELELEKDFPKHLK